MSIDKKQLENELLKLADTLEEDAADLWIEIANKYEVEYEKKEIDGFGGKKMILEAKDPQMAKKKNFGSGSDGLAPTFWFNKAVREWKKEVKNLK